MLQFCLSDTYPDNLDTQKYLYTLPSRYKGSFF